MYSTDAEKVTGMSNEALGVDATRKKLANFFRSYIFITTSRCIGCSVSHFSLRSTKKVGFLPPLSLICLKALMTNDALSTCVIYFMVVEVVGQESSLFVHSSHVGEQPFFNVVLEILCVHVICVI